MKLYDYQEQAYNEVKQHFRNEKHRVLVVAPCGWGKSFLFAKMAADTISKNRTGEVLILTHRKELLNQHKQLFDDLKIDTARIRIESVFTEVNRMYYNLRKPLLIIADESHLARAKSWQKVIEYYNTYTVGFTASPCRLDNKPLGDIFQEMVESVSVQYLIDHHKLAPFEYYAPMTVNTEGLNTIAGDYKTVDLEELMCNNFIYGDIIKAYKTIADREQAIAYCVNVKHARETARLFQEHGYKAAAIYGGIPDKKRDQIMEDFRSGKITILCNCGIISEGISVNNCSVCILLRPTQSLALNIQQSMRCMRVQEGKVAKIIDCVGNYTRHGLPTTQHDWSLTQPVKKHENVTATGDYLIRTCPYCFRTFKTAAVCPYCNKPYPVTEREIRFKKEIEIKRIEQEDMEKLEQEKKKKRREVRYCKTRADLIKVAKERGYKMGWVWHMCKLKGIK